MIEEREDETAETTESDEQPGFTEGPTPSEEDLSDPEVGGVAGGGPAGA